MLIHTKDKWDTFVFCLSFLFVLWQDLNLLIGDHKNAPANCRCVFPLEYFNNIRICENLIELLHEGSNITEVEGSVVKLKEEGSVWTNHYFAVNYAGSFVNGTDADCTNLRRNNFYECCFASRAASVNWTKVWNCNRALFNISFYDSVVFGNFLPLYSFWFIFITCNLNSKLILHYILK